MVLEGWSDVCCCDAAVERTGFYDIPYGDTLVGVKDGNTARYDKYSTLVVMKAPRKFKYSAPRCRARYGTTASQ
jgi:hypothetical protein